MTATIKTQIGKVILGFLILTFINCSGKRNSTRLTTQDIDSINVRAVMLQDSIQATWKVMQSEDDEKLTYMKRLIDEVSYTNVYDQQTYDSLAQSIEQLKAMRYDDRSMANSESIDQYDSATRSVLNRVITFAENHPKYEDYPIMKELIDDIIAFDQRVIYRRVDYDNFIETNQKVFSENGKNYTKKPLFQLTE